MQPFLTGSRAYGKPKPTSDIDIVMLVDQALLTELQLLADDSTAGSGSYETSETGSESDSLRFGSLNLIALTDPVEYGVWYNATHILREAARRRAQNGIGGGHVTREMAKELISAMLSVHTNRANPVSTQAELLRRVENAKRAAFGFPPLGNVTNEVF